MNVTQFEYNVYENTCLDAPSMKRRFAKKRKKGGKKSLITVKRHSRQDKTRCKVYVRDIRR